MLAPTGESMSVCLSVLVSFCRSVTPEFLRSFFSSQGIYPCHIAIRQFCHIATLPYCHKVSLDPTVVSPPTPRSPPPDDWCRNPAQHIQSCCAIRPRCIEYIEYILRVNQQWGAEHATGRKIISPGAAVGSTNM